MRLAKLVNKPSPLEGEGRVRGALPEELPPHPILLPPGEKGNPRKNRLLLGCFAKCMVPKLFYHRVTQS